MHFLAVLNRDGGTLKAVDLDAFGARMRETLVAAGHTLETRVVAGEEIVPSLKSASGEPAADVVIAGGGDGTVSAAAAAMMGNNRALAVLPAGTMNLFARSLGLPLDLDEAVHAFASGHTRDVDMASADGLAFIHQYSLGMHPKLVHLRSRMGFGSRAGKLGASARAALETFLKPPRVRVALSLAGTEIRADTSALSITNNLYGEGHLPYAAKPDGGVLGIYIARARRRRDLAWFLLNMAIGRWSDNEQVEIREATEVTVKILSPHRRFKCAIDGELHPLAEETVIRCHPGALRVLVPDQQAAPADA